MRWSFLSREQIWTVNYVNFGEQHLCDDFALSSEAVMASLSLPKL